MNRTDNTVMTTAQVAELVVGHVAQHGLAEPTSLFLSRNTVGRPDARVQVSGIGLVRTAALLLAWASTLPNMTLQVWRPEGGASVHLDVDAILTGPAGEVELTVFGGVEFDAAVFPGLEPGQRRPVSLGQLAGWATGGGAEVAA